MGFFHCLEVKFLKTTIEQLTFPCEIKNKLKIKVSKANLSIEFLSGHIIKFNHTNLSITEPHRIIVKNSKQTLVALLYDNIDKIYLPRENAIISYTKYISILNKMNKN